MMTTTTHAHTDVRTALVDLADAVASGLSPVDTYLRIHALVRSLPAHEPAPEPEPTMLAALEAVAVRARHEGWDVERFMYRAGFLWGARPEGDDE